MGIQDQTIDFRMYFSGLMVFDPRAEELDALLVNARQPGSVAGTEHIPPHIAVVQFPWDDAVGDKRPFGKFLDADGQPRGYWPLDADVLELDPATETVEKSLDLDRNPPRGRELPADQDDRTSIGWIAPLRGDSTRAELKRDLFDGHGRPAIGGSLAAMVRMTRGTVRPAAFASELLRFVVLEFPDDHRQAIASVVEHRVRVKGPCVRLVARKFDGTPGDVLELVPPRQGGNRVEVWVLNREWDSVERQLPPKPLDFRQGNPDYLFFDNLLANPAPRQPRGADRVRSGVSPNVAPCLDPVMRRLYFPTGEGGEMTLAAPCSPTILWP